MAQRFFNKTTRVKYVRPYSNNAMVKKEYNTVTEKKEEIMIDNRKIEQIDELLNNMDGKELPKQKVKMEKKDKGLIERTENSKIVITEDNKMVLND